MKTMLQWPPLSAIFYTYFDDTKGHTVVSWHGDIDRGHIEHTTLPSGSHLVEEDLICFTHQGYPGVGLYRRKPASHGRGSHMATVGVVLSETQPEDLFLLAPLLSDLYDKIEEDRSYDALGHVWKTDHPPLPHQDPAASVRNLLQGGSVSQLHPVRQLPFLIHALGPLIGPVHRAAMRGERIILYGRPPLAPLAAFAWCISAMSLAIDNTMSTWLGNVSLMDMSDLTDRPWVATTSEAIYRAQPIYDLFIDLSVSPPILTTPGGRVDYWLSDIPFYRSLLGSSRVDSLYSQNGGWLLLAYDAFKRIYGFCSGCCAYAMGQGAPAGIAPNPSGEGDNCVTDTNGDAIRMLRLLKS